MAASRIPIGESARYSAGSASGASALPAVRDHGLVKVIVFGATGMIGQAVLNAALAEPAVEAILVVTRTPLERRDPRIKEVWHSDFHDFTGIRDDLVGYDACLFCLGVTSVGKKEPDYRAVTYDITMAAANLLAEVNPGMAFLYVSGVGTDSTEKGRRMWARVKGETENALLSSSLDAYAIRPAFVRPTRGVRSKTPLYAALYAVTGWLYPLMRRLAPDEVLTAEELGRAMLKIAAERSEQKVFEPKDMRALITAS